MKKYPKTLKSLVSMVAVLAMLTTLFGVAIAEEAVDYGPSVTLTMGTTGAVDDISTKAAQYFCDIVKERSGGQMTISLFPASRLGAALDQMEMLSGGSIDLFLEANYMPNFGVNDSKATSVMFVTRSQEDFINLSESDLMQELMDQFLEKTAS